MFQKIKKLFSKKNSAQHASKEILQISEICNEILSFYIYPKYKEETLVIVLKKNVNAFDVLQNVKIKNILKKVPFICLEKREIEESVDVFTLQFFDIKKTSTLLFGEDIFANINIENSDLRRKIEFDIRNKNIYLRQEIIRNSATKIIHNIVPELNPVLHGAKNLNICLDADELDNLQNYIKHKKFTEKQSLKILKNISIMLERWADIVDKYEVEK